MNIILNGANEVLDKEISVQNFIENLSEEKKINLSGAVILINTDLVKKDNWHKTIIKENDDIEVLAFVSGG
ncbi:MAG: sulfur carrier protein ThiS [Fusobacterium sp. JB021]|nr:sulfur carrier protein ThiS [Fusobacterium sp. JB021]MDP0506396.1 sulfur carrier protein ThiS [Fusobacterium sp. JB019]